MVFLMKDSFKYIVSAVLICALGYYIYTISESYKRHLAIQKNDINILQMEVAILKKSPSSMYQLSESRFYPKQEQEQNQELPWKNTQGFDDSIKRSDQNEKVDVINQKMKSSKHTVNLDELCEGNLSISLSEEIPLSGISLSEVSVSQQIPERVSTTSKG
jgi:hypothetical protein